MAEVVARLMAEKTRQIRNGCNASTFLDLTDLLISKHWISLAGRHGGQRDVEINQTIVVVMSVSSRRKRSLPIVRFNNIKRNDWPAMSRCGE